MIPSRDDVLASIRATFAPHDVEVVIEVLDAYGVETCERERERVQRAVLSLSEGSVDRREYVAAAKRDYRDVLFWAEYPDESKIDTPDNAGRSSSCSRSSASIRRVASSTRKPSHDPRGLCSGLAEVDSGRPSRIAAGGLRA
jgi:hypothetical protein